MANPEEVQPNLDEVSVALSELGVEESIVSQAIRIATERKRQEQDRKNRFELIAGIIAGYEHILGSELAHTQDALVYSCAKYLQTPKDEVVPSEMDASARLYAAYFLASETYAVEDETGKTYKELVAEGGVDQGEVLWLLTRYRDSRYTHESNPGSVSLEDIVEKKMFRGQPWVDFLPFPGIIPNLKQQLFDSGHGNLYEDLLPGERE